jgi:ADP-ribose pyrophosphatase YjhB (NUDIX family)
VLLVNDADQVLLFRGGDPARPGLRWWFTPGGGLDAGESPAQGAARELAEETGLRARPAQLGEPVWHETVEFTFDGQWYRQPQHFYLLRVPQWEVDTGGFEEAERVSVDGHRWWTVAELAQTRETCYPSGLAELLRRCLAERRASAVPQGGSRC